MTAVVSRPTPSARTRSVTSDCAGESAVLGVSGDLDTQFADEFRTALRSVVRLRLLILDLSEVTFIDSASLGVLIGGIRDLHEHGGRAVLVARTGPTLDLLDRVGVTSLVPVYSVLGEANAHLRQQGVDSIVERAG